MGVVGVVGVGFLLCGKVFRFRTLYQNCVLFCSIFVPFLWIFAKATSFWTHPLFAFEFVHIARLGWGCAMAKTFAAVLVGVEIEVVEIECFVGSGFSGLTILGLTGDVVRDMRERVRAVLEGAGLGLPARKIVVSFLPLQVLKLCRTSFDELDFAVAASVVRALDEERTNKMKSSQNEVREFFAGSLSLSGELRPISRPLVMNALEYREFVKRTGAVFHVAAGTHLSSPDRFSFYSKFVDWMNGRNVVKQKLVKEMCASLEKSDASGKSDASKNSRGDGAEPGAEPGAVLSSCLCDSEFVVAKRESNVIEFLDMFRTSPKVLVTILAAVAGGHNVLLAGEPGVGKSFAMKHLEMLLSPLSDEEAFQVQLISDEQGIVVSDLSKKRPFRAPHHSCTSAALVGGANLKPGEVTLAHNGVLFMDELAEFSRLSLEALREPLDSGKIAISRAAGSIVFPARFLFCATTNPCPCGFLLSRKKSCRCSTAEMSRYLSRLSGPLLDRFALQVILEPDVPERDVFSRCVETMLRNGEERTLATRFLQIQKDSSYRRNFNLNLAKLAGAKGEGVSRRTDAHLESIATTLLALFPEVEQATWEDVASFRVMEQRFARVRS